MCLVSYVCLFSFIDLQDGIRNNLQGALATLWAVHRRICLGLDIFQTLHPGPTWKNLEKSPGLGIFMG